MYDDDLNYVITGIFRTLFQIQCVMTEMKNTFINTIANAHLGSNIYFNDIYYWKVRVK